MTNAEALAWIKQELDYLRRAPELNGCDMTPEWAEQIEVYTIAAQAIRERDALLADVSDYQGNICAFCKNFKRIAHRSFCEHFDNLPMEDGVPLMCGRWEWRGVNHDTE